MKTRLDELADEYVSGLEAYLKQRDEAGLTFAYELGRRAMIEGVGVLDMAALHRAALEALVLPAAAIDQPRFADAAAQFFNELLAPFEMSLQGYRAALAASEERFQLAEDALRISREELRRLSAHIQHIREEEKARIARELHDDLGQQLTALKMAVTLVEHNLKSAQARSSGDDLRGMYTLIDQLIDSVRRIATDLRPAMLDDLGLIPAIEWLINEFSARYHVRVIRNVDAKAIAFNRASRIEVFRMVQEALTNVARHSGATEVVLDIVRDGPHCIVRIVDNGRGATRDAHPNRHSFGLLGMRERAALLGGEIRILTAPNSGFALTAILPLAAVEAREVE